MTRGEESRPDQHRSPAWPSTASPARSAHAPGATGAPRWTALCRLDEIAVGRAKYVEAGNKALTVVRMSETDAAVFDDACPHAGASLSGGRVYDGCLVCPLHGWEFRLTDGACPDAEAYRTRKYSSRVVDGVVEALILQG